MKIINLTQHRSTQEQKAAGVVDLSDPYRAKLAEAITFEGTSAPSQSEILRAAKRACNLVSKCVTAADRRQPEAALIGGALWLMAPLARELRHRGIKPLFAYSRRESAEFTDADGSVSKRSIFRHIGFVEAVE